jgi:hypothetical protein
MKKKKMRPVDKLARARFRNCLRDEALERVIIARKLYIQHGTEPFGVALDRALDNLAVAHVTMTKENCLDR